MRKYGYNLVKKKSNPINSQNSIMFVHLSLIRHFLMVSEIQKDNRDSGASSYNYYHLTLSSVTGSGHAK